MRNLAIDQCKGWLIILVIIGHWVLGSINDQMIRYVIYSFHMPLFIGLGGFLLNKEKHTNGTWLALAKKYWYRVVLPFIPALLFFTSTLLIHAAEEGRLSINLLLAYLTTPYYHLWYIPTVLLWTILAILLLKIKMPVWLFLLTSAIPALSWAGFNWLDIESSWGVLVDKKLFFYAYFFFLGMVYTQYWLKLQTLIARTWKVLLLILIISSLVFVSYVGKPGDAVSAFTWFIMNNSLLLLVLFWVHKPTLEPKQGSLITAIGRNSLPIYLWHVLPLFILKGFDIHQHYTVAYYFLSLLSISALVYFLLKLENHSPFLNRWLYGKS